MFLAFISIGFFDIVDVVLTAFLLYQLYLLLRGTIAINILVGMIAIYLFWVLVKALQMELLSTIMGQFMGVGVIAMIIVFQQEIRRFFLLIGSRYLKSSSKFKFGKFFSQKEENNNNTVIASIVSESLISMGKSKTGALIVVTNISELKHIINSGLVLNADISKSMIKSVFFKNSPLHDGAMIISKDKIIAARCMLPLTQRTDIPGKFGLRHRSAIGISENSDAIVFIVSEETGSISYSIEGKLEQISKKEEIIEIFSIIDN